MHIAIDGNEANISQRVGSNVYAYHVLTALAALIQSREDIEVTILLSQAPVADLPEQRPRWTYKVFGPQAFWTQWALPQHLFWQRKAYDVLFSPGHYAPRWSPIPYVSSVMDLAYIFFPEQFRRKDRAQLSEWTRYSVQRAKKTITISEHSKRDIVREYHRLPDDVIVAYPGVTPPPPAPKDKQRVATLKKWGIHHPFLLCVGTLQPRKNLLRLIEAFEEVVLRPTEEDLTVKGSRYLRSQVSQRDELQLVFAGKVGWLAKAILERIARSPLRERIIVTGFVTEEEKAILYQESVASALVGLYEGYGMPAIEALQGGSLPIVSETTSLPEVVGEAGIFVDPCSVSSIKIGIETVLTLPARQRAQYLRMGRQQIKQRSWQKTAETILNVLVSVGNQKP